jgi:Tfp pilus assembly protein FimV
LPWLRKAAFAVRKAGDQVLEIRSDVPLREPVMQMRIQLGCGHEISRDYILMASPVRDVPRNALGSYSFAAGTVGGERCVGACGSAPGVCARCNRQPMLCRPA